MLLIVFLALSLPGPAFGQDSAAQDTSGAAATGQDASQPGDTSASSSAPADESAAPEITPAAKTPINPVPQTEPAAVQPPVAGAVIDACLQEILAQQQKTRMLRDLRDMLPRPPKEEYEKVRRPFVKLLEEGYGATDVKTIQMVLEYRMLQATDPEFVQTPTNMILLNRDITNEVTKCGSKIGNAASKKTARRKFNLEVLAVAKKLLTNNLDSRMSAVTIISQLYDEEPQGQDAKLSIIKESIDALVDVLNDKEQPDSIKVRAADALSNILRNCNVAPQDQDRISDGVGDQLARPCSEAAFQLILIETLMMLNQPLRTVGSPEPLAMKHFAAVLNDKSRPIEVRCHAALGVGRAAWHPRFKADPLAWKIADLAVETGVRFTKAGPGDRMWEMCGGDLFFSLRALDATPLEANKGLLNRAPSSTVVRDSSALVIAVAVPVVENKSGVPISTLEALADWRDKNRPADMQWDSSAPPLNP